LPAISPYALVSLADFKAYLGAGGAQSEVPLTNAINVATTLIEREVDRELVTRGNIVEYHSLSFGGSYNYYAGGPYQTELYTGQWPIIAVASVYESGNQPPVYDGTTLLAASAYELVSPRGVIRRLVGFGPGGWVPGNRGIQITYSAGYRALDGLPVAAAAVPDDIRQACMFVAASIAQESERKQWGVSSMSDALGNVTRFMGYMPPSMREILSHYRRPFSFGRTWERAS
jgi:hypothetical protein